MTALTLNIDEIYQKHRPLVGGKGANMGDLARGLRVPPGFCLSTEAYDLHLKQDLTFLKVKELAAQIDHNDMAGVERLGAEITAVIENMAFPPEVEKAIREAYAALAKNNASIKVAVRSSATAEDLEDASFAGQQESFLNVEGIDNVLASVKKCWVSLWSPRAVHYRSVKGFGHDVKMAVIIQEMVPAQVAGVMFSANPVSNDRREILIEAVPGLGEALVSGELTGDNYVVAKEGLKVISQTLAEGRTDPLLTEGQIRQLALYAFKIEEYYEAYQDVEWALYRGEIYVLQTRPITTLADEELMGVDWDALTPIQKEMLSHAEERYPEPVHPLDGSLVRITYSAYYDAMRKYGYDASKDIDWRKVEQGLFPDLFVPPVARAGLKRALYALLTLPGSLKRDPAAGWAAEQPYLMDVLRKLAERDMGELPFEVIYEYIREAYDQYHFFIVMRYEYFVQNRVPSDFFLKFLQFLFGEEGKEVQEHLLLGIPCTTMDVDETLRQLAESARNKPEVARAIAEQDLAALPEVLSGVAGGEDFMREFGALMEKYGDRETSMGLGGLAEPNWRDAPEVVFGILRGLLAEEPGSYDERCRKQEERRRTAEEKLKGRLTRGIWKVLPLRGLIDKFIRQNRQFAVFRENSHYDVTRSLAVFQRLYTELGKRFVRRGFIKEPKDILFMTYHDIKELMLTVYHGFDLNVNAVQQKIEDNKAALARRKARWKSRHQVVEASATQMVGIASSSGVATGPACVVNHPRDFGKVQPGDILVAPYTNPSWTPLFATAAGLVVDTGGATSHASVIAREYGIPAVMGLGEATARIKDGEIITVNGSAGVVLFAQ